MEIDYKAAHRKIQLALEAEAKGQVFFSKENLSSEFNRGCNHISGLLHSAFQLYVSESFPTSIFIAITAIEEIAKLKIALYRNESLTAPAKNRKEDHLFSHKAKHSIALQEVIAVGTRLPNAIGEERVRELLNMAETGELIRVRESSLYINSANGKFTTPKDIFTKKEAREILLLALEAWDDRLVGLTDYTFEIDKELTNIFDIVSK